MMEIHAPKGERTRVLYIWSSSMPGAIRFSAETQSGNPPGGLVETSIRRILPRKTTEYPLKAKNRLTKGVFDSSYQIFVTPDEDTTITVQSWHFQARHLIWAVGILIGLAVISTLVPFLLRSL